MLYDLVIKPLPTAHFWKCYCAARSLGQGHVQKLHTSNKDLLLEQLLHLKQPDISSFPTGSSFSPESCMAAKKLIWQDWNWGPFLSFSKPCSDSLWKGKKHPAKNTGSLGVGRSNQNTECLGLSAEQGSFQVQVFGTVHPWADELLWGGVVLWMNLGWSFGDSSNIHIISLR